VRGHDGVLVGKMDQIRYGAPAQRCHPEGDLG
jgi:hypothetical protein